MNSKECCKEKKIPITCLGFCRPPNTSKSDETSVGKKMFTGRCKKHLKVIETCNEAVINTTKIDLQD